MVARDFIMIKFYEYILSVNEISSMQKLNIHRVKNLQKIFMTRRDVPRNSKKGDEWSWNTFPVVRLLSKTVGFSKDKSQLFTAANEIVLLTLADVI